MYVWQSLVRRMKSELPILNFVSIKQKLTASSRMFHVCVCRCGRPSSFVLSCAFLNNFKSTYLCRSCIVLISKFLFDIFSLTSPVLTYLTARSLCYTDCVCVVSVTILGLLWIKWSLSMNRLFQRRLLVGVELTQTRFIDVINNIVVNKRAE